MNNLQIMRDVMIESIYKKMLDNKNIFFLSGDFGAPTLDKLRDRFKDRFINVGIAEQNLINISCGLALEGFNVYAYAICPFITMRPYEQIRNNLSLLSQIKEINVNLIGVGAGMSYDISGPTHHCLEDITIMRLLPNIVVFSPSDVELVRRFVDFSINVKKPKYIRLDSKPLPQIYNTEQKIDLEKGFYELKKGKDICLISTGIMTHKALKVAQEYSKDKIGVIDVFVLKPIKYDLLFDKLKKYKYIITIEEGFINKGGLDSLILSILNEKNSKIKLKKMGLKDKYVFAGEKREYLHKLEGISEEDIMKVIKSCLKENC